MAISQASTTLGLGIAFSVLALITTTGRVVARRATKTGLRLSDWINISNALVKFVFCTLIEWSIINLNPSAPKQALPIEKGQLIGDLLSTVLIGTSKISVLLFYREVFETASFQILANLLIAVCTLWTTIFFFLELFIRDPAFPPISDGKFAPLRWDSGTMWVIVAVLDIILDISIVSLPVPILLRLKVKYKKKALYLGMFLLGALVTVASTTRLYYIVKIFLKDGRKAIATTPEELNDNIHVIYWTMLESSISIVAASLPLLAPLFRREHGFQKAFTALKNVLEKLGSWFAVQTNDGTRFASDANNTFEIPFAIKRESDSGLSVMQT